MCLHGGSGVQLLDRVHRIHAGQWAAKGNGSTHVILVVQVKGEDCFSFVKLKGIRHSTDLSWVRIPDHHEWIKFVLFAYLLG